MKEKLTYVLIGASGHLGGTLISLLLAAGNPIRAFDFKFPKEKIESPLLHYYLGDVTKPETLTETFSGLEPHSFCVIHLAALISIQANRANPAMLSVNVEGVKNVFHEFEEKQGARFIYVSSVDAFLQTRSLVNEASPLVSDFEHGKIINICSMMSELGRETVSAYAAAKGGLKMLTRNICSEYGGANIQCNGIGPGYIETPQTAPLRVRQPDGSRHPFDAFIVAKTPAGRWGKPEDLQGPAVFLASDASNFVNGHILYVDGGILAYIGKQPGND